MIILIPAHNVANHWQQKAERRRSGAFCRPGAFALLYDFVEWATNFPPIIQNVLEGVNKPGIPLELLLTHEDSRNFDNAKQLSHFF